MVTGSPNPFVFAGPVGTPEIAGRDSETKHLLELVAGGHWARLEAPRRYGKTSLLGRVGEEAEGDGMVTAHVNFEDVLSIGGVVARIERAYSRSLKGPLRRTVERLFDSWGLGLSLGAGGFALELKSNPQLDAEVILLRLLELPAHLHERKGVRCLIIFDEVQDLLDVRGAAGTIRSVIQHQADAASYAFAGSAPGLMRRLFDEPDSPFLNQGVGVRLDPLDSTVLAPFLDARFARTGKDAGDALSPLLRFTRGHPQRTIMLSHHLWAVSPGSKPASAETWIDAREAALEQARPALRAGWAALPATERRAAAALAMSPEQPGARDVIGAVGLPQDSLYGALERLQDRGEVITAGGSRRLTDPLLEYWLRERKELP